MLAKITSVEYRNRAQDSFGNGWIYSWFCVDHVGYNTNLRRRDIGHHKIFDHYMKLTKLANNKSDSVHFHYHPMPFNYNAHHCATSYFGHSNTLYQILSRKIIDRSWFPCVFRPGFHAIRPDSHWFLEQFIPFDFSNQSSEPDSNPCPDLKKGRFGDWRRAPRNWQPYHPAHTDYQLKGDCQRLIMRCLNIGTRHHLLKQSDVDQAFTEALEGKPVVLSFTHHDFRDMQLDIDNIRKILTNAKAKFPDVKFKYCEAKNAVCEPLGIKSNPEIKMDLQINGGILHVRSNTSTFGPQPFLAIKTKEGEYFHDNFDFQVPFIKWTYMFDEQTIPLEKISAIGVASCDRAGNVSVSVIDTKFRKKYMET